MPTSPDFSLPAFLRGREVSIARGAFPSGRWPEQSHRELQIVLLLDPSACTLRWRGENGEWQSTDVRGPLAWLLAPGVPHELNLLEPCDLAALHVSGGVVTAVMPDGPPHSLCASLGELGARDLLLISLPFVLRPRRRESDGANPAYLEAAGTVLARHLLHALCPSRQTDRKQGLSPDRLQRITRHIDAHLSHHLDSATLARMTGLSRSHFIRQFKRSLGLTPRDFVMHCRTVKAHGILLDTDEKVSVVADLCGFSDDTHLTRWLRRVFNVLPTEIRTNAYRQQNGRHNLP